MNAPMQPIEPRRGLRRALFWLCALGFLAAVSQLAMGHVRGQREEQAFRALSRTAQTAAASRASQPVPAAAPPVQAEPVTQMSEPEDAAQAQAQRAAGYAALGQHNPDYAAWLQIPGTQIDYPVMYTPEQPEHYLYRAFDGTESASGTPFIGAGADVDSDCLIIYGHNMKSGTMFGELDAYRDASFWAAHPRLTLYVGAEARSYAVFAAVQTRVLYTDETGFRYYYAAGSQTEDSFRALTGWLAENALYATDGAPAYGEQILLLSTCSYHTEEGRFVVAARRLPEPAAE